jgi:ADP-ribose pyrophosphatase YjhB (NUDIX family)
MRAPIPTWAFSVVVVKKGRRFLLVRETKHEQLWYLPAGRVEPGETFVEAAIRETREEGGIAIAIEGVIRIEHSPQIDGTARMRVIFLARPDDDAPPKSVPDEESLEARWVSLDELDALPLRGSDVERLLRSVLEGRAIHPLSVLVAEGTPY